MGCCKDADSETLLGHGGIAGWKLGSLMQDLVDHGCKGCGSVPQGHHWGSNNPKEGILTVNFVDDPFGKPGGVPCECSYS